MQASIQSPSNPLYPPASDTLIIDSFNGLPINYRWALAMSSTTAGSDASGTLGQPGYIPAVPPVTTYTTLQQGNDKLTDAQWASWTTQSDQTYMLGCAATNLGVTLS